MRETRPVRDARSLVDGDFGPVQALAVLALAVTHAGIRDRVLTPFDGFVAFGDVVPHEIAAAGVTRERGAVAGGPLVHDPGLPEQSRAIGRHTRKMPGPRVGLGRVV